VVNQTINDLPQLASHDGILGPATSQCKGKNELTPIFLDTDFSRFFPRFFPIEYRRGVGFGDPRAQLSDEPANRGDPLFPPLAPLLVLPLLGLFLKELLKGHELHSPSQSRSFANHEPW